jgi:aminopeptidase-like protein
MNTDIANQMYSWATDLFPINRSLTGKGVRETLNYIRSELPQLELYEVPTGTAAYDWNVPKEWDVSAGWIADLNGNKLIDFCVSNLHVMGYSTPVNSVLTRSELDPHLHSLPEQPNAIPYVTSYYAQNWGFCLSQDQRDNLGDGPFHVFIDSKLFDGSMTYGELLVPGQTSEEILYSTYVCHPSLANNELSGPVVSMALAKHIQSLNYRKYSYRFLFTVETIGSIYYISKNIDKLQQNLKCGWVLTCIGDDRSFSYVPTRSGNSLTDVISKRVLIDMKNAYVEHSWLDRGSDERQFNAPGVDLPVASLMRSKYGTYPEYHTHLDDLDVISPQGLLGGLEMMINTVEILESNEYWKINTICEPQMGKRGLYPTTSIKSSGATARDQMNIISYLDGNLDLLDVAEKCNTSYKEVQEVLKQLISADLVSKVVK